MYEVVASTGERLLLDPGVRWSELEKAVQYKLSNIVGALASHEHRDHCKCVPELIHHAIDCYISRETAESLEVQKKRRTYIIDPAKLFIVKPFWIYPFSLIHDVPAMGFIIHDMKGGDWLLFCPDSGFIEQRFNVRFDIIAIECSYDAKILSARVDSGDINEQVAKRIVENHTEKQTAIEYLEKYCALSKCREIHLLHCSGANLNKKKTKREFEKIFFREVIIK
jgi:phosphoribosyl 1,2-cyclic phosphodiesterase